MKWIQKSTVILFLAIILILVISCAGTTPTQQPSTSSSIISTTPPAQTTSSSPTSSTITSPTPSTSPIATSPTPSTSPIATSPTASTSPVATSPTVSPSPTYNPATDERFYIDKTISGYNQTPRPDGTFEKTPIYQDIYLDLNVLGYYTEKDAIFVPRIPTLTDHDDWFIRFQVPTYLLKPWLMNWGYTVNNSNSSATLSATVYTQEIFEANYYHHPDSLLSYDLKGDKEPSSSGINCKYFQSPGSYVILLRTNDASTISDFWIKLGTEGSIITPTP